MTIYEQSRRETSGDSLMMIREGNRDFLFSSADLGFSDAQKKNGGFAAPCSAENAAILRQLVPETAPVPVLGREKTFGLGDRLGIAGPGQLAALAGKGVTPVLAQSSIRELNLTRRTFSRVLDAATFAAFRMGWRDGFGADGDHVKTAQEVQYALDTGMTMITLDCSEHIHADARGEAPSDVAARYADGFTVEGQKLSMSREELNRAWALYGEALSFAAGIYETKIAGKPVDLELSVDETSTPTTPAQHAFVASEMRRMGVKLATLAPRFPGEFQKGIDYRGDLEELEHDMQLHAALAREFGYKLSLHSGSDKFSVFPVFAKATRGCWHVKTAGTHWLEAMTMVSQKDPALFRQCFACAWEHFQDARAYYHVTTDLTKIPDVAHLTDDRLPALFAQDDFRQLIHITYEFLLRDYGSRLYALWAAQDDAYFAREEAHTLRHLKALGL